MQRLQKNEFIDSFRQTLGAVPLVVVARYGGNGVNATNQIRRKFEASGIRFQVVKNTLARKAVAGTELEGLSAHLTGMSLMILSSDDPVASAKVLREVLAGNENIAIKGGYWDGMVLDADGVKSVADMPSRPEMLSMLLATLQEPGRQVLSLLEAPARDLLNLLHNFETKLSEASEA
jgi:large subunit ribosomal protein L10